MVFVDLRSICWYWSTYALSIYVLVDCLIFLTHGNPALDRAPFGRRPGSVALTDAWWAMVGSGSA